jgi:hypothetical protein
MPSVCIPQIQHGLGRAGRRWWNQKGADHLIYALHVQPRAAGIGPQQLCASCGHHRQTSIYVCGGRTTTAWRGGTEGDPTQPGRPGRMVLGIRGMHDAA